jgi:Spy/CpxP family protein refolding chaperone
MKATFTAGLLAALAILALAPPAGAQSSFPWWKTEQFQKQLGLNADQIARIDTVFQSALPKLRQEKEELDRLEAELSRMIAADVDEIQVTKEVDRVESVRAHLNKMRTLMLVHMRQVLTPDQRAKMNALHEQWEKDHKKESR